MFEVLVLFPIVFCEENTCSGLTSSTPIYLQGISWALSNALVAQQTGSFHNPGHPHAESYNSVPVGQVQRTSLDAKQVIVVKEPICASNMILCLVVET
jgi:hypothetical protein